MTASDFDHAHGFLLTRGRSPYMRRLTTYPRPSNFWHNSPDSSLADVAQSRALDLVRSRTVPYDCATRYLPPN